MASTMDPGLTVPDAVVLTNLFKDIEKERSKQQATSTPDAKDSTSSDEEDIKLLSAYNNKDDILFQPTVFTTWDEKDLNPTFNKYIAQPYCRIAQNIVRHPTDVVFLTHLLVHFTTVVPSAIYLFHSFSYIHAVLHTVWAMFCAGPFTLMMHNHIHNNGILNKRFSWIDFAFPYILEPLMGHTWDSYYYHHVKHHHVEGNNPDDLSSTIRYQRDDVFDFLCYVGRFSFFIWLELPLYFLRKGKTWMAFKSGMSEYLSYGTFYYLATRVNMRASIFVMLIPFCILRFAMMVGNFGQHALVDELEPDSDFRSSITLIDVPSNRFCFNDGYHTAHHLNPRRHWREQPVHFLKSKEAYTNGRALVFHNIDYNMMTFRLLRKDYLYLADCLVPIGEDQIRMTRQEIADMLRTKTKKFSEEDIRKKFPGVKQVHGHGWTGHLSWLSSKLGAFVSGHAAPSVEKTK